MARPASRQTPLWDQKLSSVQSYTVYSSGTMVNTPNPSPPLGTDSTLCLSCHDGTVAGSPGALVPYGNVPMSGQMNSGDVFGTNLSTMHPINFKLPLQCLLTMRYHWLGPVLDRHHPHPRPIQPGPCGSSTEMSSAGAATILTCRTSTRTDPNFLVIDNSSGALCLACHSTVPTRIGDGSDQRPTVASQSALRGSGIAAYRQGRGEQYQSAGRVVDEHPRHRVQPGAQPDNR